MLMILLVSLLQYYKLLQVYSIKLIRAKISGNLNRIFIKVGSNRRTVTNHIFICQQTIARIVEFGSSIPNVIAF